MSDETILRVEHVSKRFGRTVALHDLDMAVARGAFVTFLGPSGCGKSTTLRILGGFETPDSGRIVLGGADVTRLPPDKRPVNMVFQDYALFPHMNVRRNIAFGLELAGRTRPEIDARVDELLAFLELEALRERRPDQLSGGQKQRVALARALAPDPALLLLDEPLGALDAKLRGQVQQELKSIQRRTGKTFLFVTHDQDEALTMSDRIVVMNEGRVEQDGTPEDLYFRPASRFVATFVGETNLLDGIVRGRDGAELVIDWAGRPVRGLAGAAPVEVGQRVGASVRLEKVRVGPTEGRADNAVPVRIVDRSFKGTRTALDMVVEASRETRLRAYVDTDAARDLSDGPAFAGWDADAMTVLRD